MGSPSRSGTPSTIPTKRHLEDDHTPSISSPLNPDAASRAKGETPKAPARGQREKKDSLKKRESAGIVKEATPEKSSKKRKVEEDTQPAAAPSPQRYNHPLPKEAWHYSVRDPVYAPREPIPFYLSNGVELKKPLDHAENKKNFRYTHCIADPSFTSMRYYRNCDAKPYGPRMSSEDSDKAFIFDEQTMRVVSNEKGWRTSRANVCAREGIFYYEVKILRGVPSQGDPVPSHSASATTAPLQHVRMGWARREAPLDVPVGFDGYSYGLTDIRLEPMHKSRMSKFMDDGSDKVQSKKSSSKSKAKSATKGGSAATKAAANKENAEAFAVEDHAREGDIIGLEIQLPSMSLHRKISDGTYNPAVDTSSGLHEPVAIPQTSVSTLDPEDTAPNIVRDRFPVSYKGSMYFESFEYTKSKAMEAYGDRGPVSKETPSPNHPDPTVRSLPHSHIKIYKNGKMIGTAFRNLMAFLPPASQLPAQPGATGGAGAGGGTTENKKEKDKDRTNQGVDDGLLGYFPAVSAFAAGVAEVNFGPDFWAPPPGLQITPSAQPEAKDEKQTTDAEAAGTPHVPKTSEADPMPIDEHSAEAITAKKAVEKEKEREEENLITGTNPPRSKLRPMSDRYTEQIAEDIYYDIVDEVDFFVQDGGNVSVTVDMD